MGLLDRFERTMERLLEGGAGSLFRQKLQPAEIGRKLERAMLSQQRASVGSQLVPNIYVVRLHPQDYAQFEAFAAGLSRQMESWLARVASQRQLTVLDRISVSLVEDETVRHRSPIIDASISDRSQPHVRAPRRSRASRSEQGHAFSPPVMPIRSMDATSAFEVPSLRQGEMHLEATSGAFTGEIFSIAEGSSTIGRSPENDVVLDAPDISRRHARIERDGKHLRIYDLNSTNGTRVNGEAIHISDLEPGDEIRLGGQTLTVASDGTSNRGQQRWR